MKVILTDYVYMHGVAGDIVDVADGFARNFLIPKKKAVVATPKAIAQMENLMQQAAMRRKELTDKLVEVAQKIDGAELVFGRKAGRNNQLYGSVTTRDIADELLKVTGIDIDRRRVSERPLRELGRFEVPIRMGHDMAPVVHVVIVPDDEVEDYLRQREAAKLEGQAPEKVEAKEPKRERREPRREPKPQPTPQAEASENA
jgi:large subunit ribosomal protein L9